MGHPTDVLYGENGNCKHPEIVMGSYGGSNVYVNNANLCRLLHTFLHASHRVQRPVSFRPSFTTL